MAGSTKAQDLRQQTTEELAKLLRDRREELFKLRFQKHTGQLENVSRVRSVRREIARALTVLDEKKRSQAS